MLTLFLLTSCTLINTYPKKYQKLNVTSTFLLKTYHSKKPVTIHWNQYAIPLIEAGNDNDLAFAFGLVHTHLRWGQMELLRILSRGRTSQYFGIVAVDLDHTLRIIDFGKKSNSIIQVMKPETRIWVKKYLQGINTYIEQNKMRLPADLQAINFQPQSWTMEDLIYVWRLASIDVNWLVKFNFLTKQNSDERRALCAKLIRISSNSQPTFNIQQTNAQSLWQTASNANKTGSNSIALGKNLTGSDSSILVNDPHLGTMLPNIWVIIGLRSPSIQTVGLTIAGIPMIALGRNPHISWGGTNMWGLSTQLIEMDNNNSKKIIEKIETIPIRWWFDRKVLLRESQFGPILTDSPFFEHSNDIALHWIGHQISDEVSSFLAIARSKNFEQFRTAFETYAVSAQNFLYADREGNIDHVLALRKGNSASVKQNQLLTHSSSTAWSTFSSSTELPYLYNPEKGFIVSTNNKPTNGSSDIGLSFSNDGRYERLNQLIKTEKKPIELATLKKWQLDVFSQSSFNLKTELIHKVMQEKSNFEKLPEKLKDSIWQELEQWNGYYDYNSRGPVAFEVMFFHLAQSIISYSYQNQDSADTAMNFPLWKSLIKEYIHQTSAEHLTALIVKASKDMIEDFEENKTWGDMHTMRLQHPLASLPIVGGRYIFSEYPSSGGVDTLFKASHNFSSKPSRVSYGANSRFIADMSDINGNYFVILGGQDGWLLSENALDQVPLWKEGKMIQIPFEMQKINNEFLVKTQLIPE